MKTYTSKINLQRFLIPLLFICFGISNVCSQPDPINCITYTGCPAIEDQSLAFCADEIVNNVFSTTLTLSDFPIIMASHDCLGNGNGQSFRMNFELNESLLGKDCWDFHYISRVGGMGGHLKKISDSHPESNDSYIIIPYLYVNAGEAVSISVNYNVCILYIS